MRYFNFKFWQVFSFLFFLLFSTVASAEYYKVEVSKVSDNLYKTSDGIYIETDYCYEYAMNEEAILSYEDYSYDNKLIFSSGSGMSPTECPVKKMFK